MTVDTVKEKALSDYRKKLLEHKEVRYFKFFLSTTSTWQDFILIFMQVDARLRDLRGQLKELQNQFDKSENDLKVFCWFTFIIISEILHLSRMRI
jgi:26S proteasome regulatory subunit T4